MDNYIEKLTASVAGAAEKINGLKADDSLVFPIFTDLHTEDVDHEYTVH